MLTTQRIVRTLPSIDPQRLGFSEAANAVSAQTAGVSRRMAQCGIRWARIQLDWVRAETAQNTWNWTNFDAVVNGLLGSGMQILATLYTTPVWATAGGVGTTADPPADMADWEDYISTTVTRFKGRIRHWEIGNEPDLNEATIWPKSQAAMAELLSRAYDVIKGISPNDKVLFPAMALEGASHTANYFEAILDDATYPCLNKFDIANYHEYSSRATALSHMVTDIRAPMITRGIGHKPVWITEFGYSDNATFQAETGYTDGAPAQPRWMQDRVPYLLNTLGAEKVFWFTWRDDPSAGALYRTHGLVTDTTHLPKPCFNVYQQFCRR